MRSRIIAFFAFTILFLPATPLSGERLRFVPIDYQSGNDSLKIDSLIQQGKSTTLDSLSIANSLYQALSLSRKHQLSEKEAAASLALSSFYEERYVNDSAKAYAQRAIALFAAQGNKRGEADAKIVLADVYMTEDSRPAAMALQFESLKYYEEVKDSLQMGMTINRIANSLNYLNQHEKALQQYDRALTIFKRLDDVLNQARVLNNIAIIFNEEGDLELSIKTYKEAIALFHGSPKSSTLAVLMGNLANAYRNYGEYDSALFYYNQSLNVSIELKNVNAESFAYLHLSAFYNNKGEPGKAIDYGNKALSAGKRMKNVQLMSNANSTLAESYEAVGRYKDALYHFRQYQQLEDSVYNTQNSRIINNMQARYESEKKEKELALKQADIERQEAMLEEQANVRNMLIAGLVIVVLAAALIYRGERMKAKAYDELKLKSREIEHKNEIIEVALKEKEALLKEIHHRVKNNLQVISSILNMQSRSTANPDMLTAIQEGQSRVKAMALIHQKLYQSEQLSEIDFKEYAEDLISHLSSVFRGSNASEVTNKVTASDIKLDIDVAIPLGLILNELISNAYKYAFEGRVEGQISVELKMVEDKLQLNVADNGRGLPVDFNLEKAKSLGLKLVNILTRQLNGELSVHSEGGTHFSILISNFKV